jgi:para-aminobenzoate synthetase component 1
MRQSSGPTALCTRELPAGFDLIEAFELLRSDPFPWLLDSALPSRRLGRFSFAGSDPYLVLRAFGERVELDCRRVVRADLTSGGSTLESDPLAVARSLLPAPPGRGGGGELPLPFAGGAVGYWGYELAQCVEPVLLHARNDLGLPDLVLLYVDRLLAVERLEGRAFSVGLGFGADQAEAAVRAAAAAEELAGRFQGHRSRPLRAAAQPRPDSDALEERRDVLSTPLVPELRSFFDEDAYANAVASIGDEIAAGNVYQANLTQRMDLPWAGEPWALYRELRRLSPAPFAAYIELPEVTIAGSSPERFLRLAADGRVESRPIKGTRRRGQTPRADALLAAELAASGKDRAENLMIVDLVRNDLGRVCQVGSVAVPELMAIEAYATVFQMVSTVTGRLRPDCDATDLIRATFPPGSMTGAPKIAAMRILDTIEPVRRGVYSGAIGYLDLRGGADLSVVIRTLLVKDGRAYLHAGGAVVADSDPVAEYHESLDKARALLAALARAGRRVPAPREEGV